MSKLYVSLTRTFGQENLYWDKGSGAGMDGAFWRPVAPDGYFILGDYAQGDYASPHGTMAVVKAQDDPGKEPLLALPVSFDRIWYDKDSGADEDGAVWVPKAPAGYVALGGVATRGYNPPPVDTIRCVRFDLLVQGTFGTLIWNDKGSGADQDIAVWNIVPPATNPGLIAAGTFYPQSNYNQPSGTVYCLKTPFIDAAM